MSRIKIIKTIEVSLLLCLLAFAGGCSSAITFDSLDLFSTQEEGESQSQTLQVEPVYPDNGSDWGQHIKWDEPDSSPFNQDDDACDGSEVPGFKSCLHGGELRKIQIIGLDSCQNVTVNDSLDAFNWVCDSDGINGALYTTGLKTHLGLSDLINLNGTFKSIGVDIEVGTRQSTIAPSTWWNNTIQELPDNSDISSTALVLGGRGNIYYTNNDIQSSGYILGDSQMSLVTLGSSKIQFNGKAYALGQHCNSSGGNGNQICLVSTSGVAFSWVEGKYLGAPISAGEQAQHTLMVANSRFSMYRNLVASYGTARAIWGSVGHSNQFINISASASHTGIVLHNQSKNRLFNIKVHGNDVDGIKLNSSESVAQNVLAAHNGSVALPDEWGVSVDTTKLNLINVTSIANSDVGIRLKGSANTLLGAVAANNDSGIEATSSNNSTLGNLFSSQNGIGMSFIQTADNELQGIAVFGQNTSNCAISYPVGNPEIENGTCVLGGGDGSTTWPSSNSGALFRTGFWTDIKDSFGGFVVNDPLNIDDDIGPIAHEEIRYWNVFQSPWSVWGPRDLGGSNPIEDWSFSKSCFGSSCQVIDYSLSTGTNVLSNRSVNGQTANAPFIGGDTCPTQLHGENRIRHADGSGFFHPLAYEKLFDLKGDEDGLCESGETCIYMPSFGADQKTNVGNGDLVRCEFEDSVDGQLIEVKMWGIESGS